MFLFHRPVVFFFGLVALILAAAPLHASITATAPNAGRLAADQKGTLQTRWTTTLSPAGDFRIELLQTGSVPHTLANPTRRFLRLKISAQTP